MRVLGGAGAPRKQLHIGPKIGPGRRRRAGGLSTGNRLLGEDGSFLLREDGGKLLLETDLGPPPDGFSYLMVDGAFLRDADGAIIIVEAA